METRGPCRDVARRVCTRDCNARLHSTRGGAVVLADRTVSDSTTNKEACPLASCPLAAWERGDRTVSAAPRHCSPSFGGGWGEAAIAHTTDRRGVSATASCLAVTAAIVHPVRDDSSVENRYADPLASRTGCNLNVRRLFLPNSHSSRNGDTTARHRTRPVRRSVFATSQIKAGLRLAWFSTTKSGDFAERGVQGLLHGRYPNTPPTPSQEGRAERRSAVFGNTGRHLIIFNSQFSILNSKEGAERRIKNTEPRTITHKNFNI
jgi:hypothetical protein